MLRIFLSGFRHNVVALAIFLLLANAADVRAASIWLEGEKPSLVEPAGTTAPVANGSPQVLSGGSWLNISLDAGKAASLPESGLVLSYTTIAAEADAYDLWLHIGYELARANFDWRLDQGDWHSVPSTATTLDVQEVGIWAPVAWLDLGKQSLTAGAHTLQIRLQRPPAKDGKPDGLNFGLDAICFASGSFHPDGPIQPGDTSWMSAADKAGQSQIFTLPVTGAAAETSLSLAGAWLYAGDDEVTVDDRLGPVKSIPAPATLNWHAMNVPGDRNAQLPTETYVHRYYLRSQIQVPAELAGHSFVLHVPAESVVATVFVNGQACGWTKNCWAAWDCDLTAAIKPGQNNDLCVAFKDSFYALDDPTQAGHLHYVPYGFWHYHLTNALDMPVLSLPATGFVEDAPSLVVGATIHPADVFVLPSVKRGTLGLEVTLHNSGNVETHAQLENVVESLAGGGAEMTFAPRQVTVPAGQDLAVKLSEPWAHPKLWWPDDPQQYVVVTRISIDGKALDEHRTKFGFREWTWDGPDFKLNGVPFHGFADIDTQDIDTMHRHGQTMVRVWRSDANTAAYLDECDAKGMPVRITGIFDGEGAAGFYNLKNPALWDNYRAQLLAWAKGKRNHPSIFIWSMENEITFINGHVLGLDKITTTENKKSADALMAMDPTRPVMTDGGNANLDESLPVYGGHYMEPPLTSLPEGAYDFAAMAHRQVWPVTQQKPILLGEADFVAGLSLADHATLGGERAFLSQGDARPAIATELRMLSEGYRWNGINFHFWEGGQLPSVYTAWQPVAVLARVWEWTFGSGEQVERTLGIFNDKRSAAPITLDWKLSIPKGTDITGTSQHSVPPGGNEKFTIKLNLPQVTERTEAVLSLTLTQDGKKVFDDTKNVSILPTARLNSSLGSDRLAVFDPKASITGFLKDAKVPFTVVQDLASLPASAHLLVIGKDALTTAESTSSALAGWASAGRAVVVLEQTNPLKFQGLPIPMHVDQGTGCLAFPEDLTHPALRGLALKDFSTWEPGGYLYRDAYVKPTSGGRSIIQCGQRLADTALVEIPVGEGLLVANQLLVGEKINSNATAQRLLLNLISYADQYKLRRVTTYVVADAQSPLVHALDGMGLKYETSSSALDALQNQGSIALVDATPENLKALASALDKVKAFTRDGGWLILNGLTPDGLANYNKLVGVEHLIRPLGREKVSWPDSRNPLTAGMSSDDIVIGTGRAISTWKAGDWPDPDAYSYVVDLDEAAAFGTSTYFGWSNAVGGYITADGDWHLIENLPPADAVIPIKLARPEKLQQFLWTSDTTYQGTTKIQLTINGKDYTFDTQPTSEQQVFDLPDQPTASELTFKVVDWTHDPQKLQAGKELVGIDNIRLKVARPPEFYDKVKPLLNIGAMVAYPNGAGGIILCNVKYKDAEQNQANINKKRAILAGLLHNLHAVFAGGKTLIAGGNLDFTPIDISHQANQFRGDQGWFGDKQHTFAGLPGGRQNLAGVDYDIYHFTTSVVQEAVMLGGPGIPGNLPASVNDIAVNRKADALFFLQAAWITQRRNPNQVKDDAKLEMADYIIHYADGKTEKVPIYSEINVENYRQGSPTAISGAQVAWESPYPEPNSNAVAYSMQWNNPRPDVAISSIDLVAGPSRVGVPVLLALTSADAKGGTVSRQP